MSVCELNGSIVTKCRVQIPSWGCWFADVTTAEELAIAVGAQATIVASDLTLVGTVLAAGTYQDVSTFRVAGGAGKWGMTLAARGYTNDAGVKVAKMLTDAALECGETLDVSTLPATTVGPHWTRQQGPASSCLSLLAEESWHVGIDGITRYGVRPETTLTAPHTVQSVDVALGVVVVASDELAQMVPGVTVEGITAIDVQIDVAAGAITTTLFGSMSSSEDRLRALRDVVRRLDPRAPYRALYSYRIVAQTGDRLDLQVVRVSTGMPDLLAVKVRPGVPGFRATNALGSVVLVAFADADPSSPFVVSFEDPTSSGFEPTLVEFGASPRFGVARLTDAVQAGPFSGAITGGSSTIKAGT